MSLTFLGKPIFPRPSTDSVARSFVFIDLQQAFLKQNSPVLGVFPAGIVRSFLRVRLDIPQSVLYD